MGIRQDIDDIVHDTMVVWLGRKGKKSKMRYILIDVLRAKYGATSESRKSPYLAAKKRLAKVVNSKKRPEPIEPDDREFFDMVDMLDWEGRLILVLCYYVGMSLKEIGKLFGMSEAGMCLKRQAALARLKTLLLE